MNIYKEMQELDDMKERNKSNMDSVLDVYKMYPAECNVLMKEMLDIERELEDVDKEIQELLQQLG
jgi:hypothetical protein